MTPPGWMRSSAQFATALVLACSALIAIATPAKAATVTTAIYPTVIINEVSTSNYSLSADEDGKYGDWIELYNTTSAAIDLTGWGLSNATKSPFRWVFPSGTSISANGYLRVWASKKDRTASSSRLHTNFNLDNGSDSVVLSAPNSTKLGQQVDFTTPTKLGPNYSWCRMPNGLAASQFKVCIAPTIGAANSGTTVGTMLDTPKLSLASGRYTSNQTVTASGPDGATLRYTTDGSVPTATSTVFPASLSISSTTVVRVAAFQTDRQRSQVQTGTYVFDQAGTYAGQRAMYVTMKPSDASSYKGHGSTSSGWDANAELITEDGTSAFNAPALAKSAGQIGSRNGQYSYPLEIGFKDALGVKEVDYPIFGSTSTTTFDKLRLRNSGDDNQEAHLRDQFWQDLGKEFGSVPAASEPVQLFINGVYVGMMDLREREDETLIESSYTGVDKDNVEFLNDYAQLAGDNSVSNFNTMYSYVTGNDMSVAANYAKASKMLDVSNLASYFAINMFAANRDWTWRNMHLYRALDYDAKWRYRIHDVDISSNGTDAWGYPCDPNVSMNDKYDYRSGSIMRALLKNSEFKNLYANAIADLLNTAGTQNEFGAKLDAFSTPMTKYMAPNAAVGAKPASVAAWQSEVAKLRRWPTDRTSYYISHTQSYLSLTKLNALSVQTSDPNMGSVQINTVDLSTRLTAANTSWTGSYWAEVPVKLTALPKPGYQFTGWSGDSTSTDRTITVSAATAGKTYRATYAALATTPAPVVQAIGNQTAVTGSTVSLQVSATDPTGHTLSYKDSKLPSGVSINKETGLIYGRPTIAGSYVSTITVSNGTTSTKITINWEVTNKLDRVVTLPTTATGDGTGLKGTYYNNTTLSGSPALTRVEVPYLDLGSGSGPVTGFGTSSWTIRWEGTITAPTTGSYTLQTVTRTDDGVRLTVDGKTLTDAWSGGGTNTATVELTANTPTSIVVEFKDISGSASLALNWKLPGSSGYAPVPLGVLDPTAISETEDGTGLTGRYYNNTSFTGTPGLTRVELPAATVGSGSGPVSGFGTSGWAIRWEGTITAPTTGSYTLQTVTRTDDGVRLIVDGKTVTDAWSAGGTNTATVELTANTPTPIVVEFQDLSGSASLALNWRAPGDSGFSLVPLGAFDPS